MLKNFGIENFALVDKLVMTFESGLNVLTGETGAGKSVIVGAISQLLGEKADKDDIRSGANLAVVEGEFDISDWPRISEKLKEFDIESPDDSLILRKEILLKGSSRNFINGRLVNLSQLREITKSLAELLGQHSHQQLLDEADHRGFLDRFAGVENEVEELRRLYYQWENARRELESLEARKSHEKNERELLIFQKDEIEKARITPGEEEKLLEEKKILDSSRILGEKSTSILNLLEQDDSSALTLLQSCRREIAQMAGLDKMLEKNIELLDTAVINLEELRTEMESYRASIPDDPERQEEINLRLDEIFRLKKKYGGTEESILHTLERIKEQLDTNLDVDDHIKILRNEEASYSKKYSRMANDISTTRKSASKKLSVQVVKELKKLGMDSAKFEYEFIYMPDDNGIELNGQRVKPGPEGLEAGRFLISANPGEPLKPLSRTASGGEISRIMLALKSVEMQSSIGNRPLLVLDEIDAGIGGQTAHMVAEELTAMAQHYQLVVITHLHQIASAANHHYAVDKTVTRDGSGRKIIAVRKLKESERKQEIKRMLSLPERAIK